MKYFSRFSIWALALWALGAFFYPQSAAAESRETRIVLGAVLPLSGENASQGIDAERGIQLALKTHAPALAGKGLKVKMVMVDDRSDPEQGKKVTRALIEEEHVQAIIGPFTSPVFLAMSPIVQQNRVVLMSGSATTPKIRKAGDYAFTLVTPDDRQGKALARFAYEILRARQGVILYLDNDYGREFQKVVHREFARLGGSVDWVHGIIKGTTDFSAILEKVKDLDPHAVFFLTYPAEGGLLLKQARDIGLEAPFLGGDGVYSQDLIDIAGEAARNTFASAMNWRLKSPKPHVRDFVKRFTTQYGLQPNLYSASYYDATTIILQSLMAGKLDAESMRQHIEQSRFQGATGEIHFESDHAVKKPIDIFKVEDYTFDYFQTIMTH
ncbi:putative Extracellular ligand-binding receptor [Nitrospina gracilis 3/211]|uniref:Putative Extracellular ligand-binding receptor n=1 Tax=Nitrospina gracilis (strain 3/211) TaxID=1266370 RepID=M1ZAP5_NITG3|nr:MULTISPECIES: ABC transporter substrate-binding protein [Nitrospina]MCF8723305.1 branched-chain amino acid transport system substrate-binding protein [Nitrospina sp. Nb-3]CCQ90355.1 putative Extracellular ligand-binding receptor [Nitrospina gracilis 3/211]